MAEYQYGWGSPTVDYEGKIIGQANRAIAAAPDDTCAYYPKIAYLRWTRRPDEALRVADAALAADPNSAPIYSARGFIEMQLGQFDRAKADALEAIRLSPRDPQIGLRYVGVGNAELALGN
jgi:Flp pilus assembly protein TadD